MDFSHCFKFSEFEYARCTQWDHLLFLAKMKKDKTIMKSTQNLTIFYQTCSFIYLYIFKPKEPFCLKILLYLLLFQGVAFVEFPTTKEMEQGMGRNKNFISK